MTAPATSDVIVIGAGIVGVCCGLYLQRSGLRVVLIDRQDPGLGCSFGNAGNLTSAACVPAALPGIVRRLPAMLLDKEGPLKVRLREIPRLLPWLKQFAEASRPEAVEEIADARQSLMSKLDEAYAPLIAEAGAGDLLTPSGLLFVYESDAGFRGAQYGIGLRRARGNRIDILSGDEARELEPSLAPSIRHAFYLPAVGHTTNPLRFTQTLANLFVRNGGTILRETVTEFIFGDRGPEHVVTDRTEHPLGRVVIAAGVWSRHLAAMLGTNVPLEAERGYHVMVPDSGVSLRVSLASGERNVAMTDMEGGLRVSGIAEYAGDSPPDYRLADLVLRHARVVLPGLCGEATSRWMGHRPALPDSKPVIGRSARHQNVFFAFGHFHNGLGLGAITGKLIAELVSGRTPSVDLTPFRPQRFHERRKRTVHDDMRLKGEENERAKQSS